MLLELTSIYRGDRFPIYEHSISRNRNHAWRALLQLTNENINLLKNMNDDEALQFYMERIRKSEIVLAVWFDQHRVRKWRLIKGPRNYERKDEIFFAERKNTKVAALPCVSRHEAKELEAWWVTEELMNSIGG